MLGEKKGIEFGAALLLIQELIDEIYMIQNVYDRGWECKETMETAQKFIDLYNE